MQRSDDSFVDDILENIRPFRRAGTEKQINNAAQNSLQSLTIDVGYIKIARKLIDALQEGLDIDFLYQAYERVVQFLDSYIKGNKAMHIDRRKARLDDLANGLRAFIEVRAMHPELKFSGFQRNVEVLGELFGYIDRFDACPLDLVFGPKASSTITAEVEPEPPHELPTRDDVGDTPPDLLTHRRGRNPDSIERIDNAVAANFCRVVEPKLLDTELLKLFTCGRDACEEELDLRTKRLCVLRVPHCCFTLKLL